jgi:hypothetical protein
VMPCSNMRALTSVLFRGYAFIKSYRFDALYKKDLERVYPHLIGV